MSKKIRRNKYIPYNPYVNTYSFGSGLLQGMGGKGAFNLTGLGSSLGGAVGAIGSAAGGAVGGLLSNGLESEAGSVFNTIGDIGSAIPGPWGAIIGGGAKIVGGLVNAAFGTKVDQEKLNAANQGTSYLNNFVSNASSFDEVQGPQAQAAVENAYKGGWFSGKKARRNNRQLREARALAQDFANRSVENNVENIADEQMNNMLANYAAFGGPLDIGLLPVGGAIDYELAQRRLAQRDLEIQGKGKFAVGGPLHTHGTDWTNGITIIDNGGSHESNPFEGVPMGVAEDGKPNLVEEGEVIYNDYVFSNRLRVPKAVREKYKLRGQKELTFADAAKQAQKESEERPNDPISQRGLEDIMTKLAIEQESVRGRKAERQYAKGGLLKHKFPDGGSTTHTSEPTTSWSSGLRFVPAIGAGLSVFSDLMGWTNKPDYSNAQSILDAAGSIGDVHYTPIGDYMRYTPLDRLFYANQLGAQAGATRRNIMNTSGGNRGAAMAGLLAADYNAQGQLGNLYRQAEEYNLGQRERVATFNRATNMFNAENQLKAQMANRDNAKIRVDAAAKAAAIRDAVDTRVGAARSANLTNLFNSLGDIGRERYAMDMITNNPSLSYDWMGRYKGRILDDATGDKTEKKANGGYITIKRKRRR